MIPYFMAFCLVTNKLYLSIKTLREINSSFFPFIIIINGTPSVNSIPIVKINILIGDNISTSPNRFLNSGFVVQTIN